MTSNLAPTFVVSRSLAAGVAALVRAQSLEAEAAGTPVARCAALAGLAIPDVTIEVAEAVTGGSFKDAAGAEYPALLPFCRVAGFATPRPASRIGFELWLPLEDWNGRYVQGGNGGLGGVIFHLELADLLRRGYATAATDNGHQASPVDGRWAIGQPGKVRDFADRAVHETRHIAGHIVERFFGEPAQRHYFYGCSEGGREAQVAAQRYPDDFDGIVAGAPASDWTALLSSFAANAKAIHGQAESFVPPDKLALVQQAAIAACDAGDGVKDGLVGRPLDCGFDPATLACADGADPAGCLTAPQLASLQGLYAGVQMPAGDALLLPGYSPGGEAELSPIGGGVRSYQFGEAPGQSLGVLFATGFFGGFVHEEPAWDFRSFDLGRDLAAAREKVGFLDATDPKALGAFAKRGGKLLQYHGWFDGSIPPRASIDFHARVGEAMGGAGKVDDFYRLFMAPGVLHCGFGPGPNAFGALGAPAPADADHDVMFALQRWVEEGVAPGRVIATKYVDDNPAQGIARQMPLCPWPKQAAWDGRGDPDAAASYRCE
jgi:feruloyl esterase